MEIVSINNHLFYSNKGVVDELILTGNDLQSELKELESRKIHAISLNRYFCNDRIADLSFLKDYPFIRKVRIVDMDIDCKGLYYLNELEELQTSSKQTLSLTQFSKLKVLITPQKKNLVFPESLETLFLWEQRLADVGLSNIAFPCGLLHLEVIKSSLTDLNGLPSSLKHLALRFCRPLKSLEGIEIASSNLESLELENCPRMTDFSGLSACSSLTRLIVSNSGVMQDISFVNNMKHLAHFTFPGTIVQDGDLSPLKSVPYVHFTNEPHYSHQLKEFNVLRR